MKITEIETIRLASRPNLLLVLVHTDEGLAGLGETFFGAAAVESYIHETAASLLLGADPLLIEEHARSLIGYVGYCGSGAEMRGNSAIDIALWDLWGKATGQPIHQLLGGRVRDTIRTYNTCAGPSYIRRQPRQAVDNWGLNGEQAPYEDLNAFLTDAGSLARDLLSEGINGMKIWPFDLCAERNRGMYLSDDELAECLRPLDSIRAAVGNEMGIAIELHSLWDLPTARRILRALTPYGLLWVEDPLRADNPDALAALARDSHVPIAVGETLAGPTAFRALFELDAVSMPIVDISWVGGITEARKIALLADSYRLPIAAHDCTGPVVLTASCHLSLHAPNALIQESVRSYYRGWYGDLVTALPIVADGHIAPPPGPGLGLELKSDLRSRPGVLTRSSRANTSAAAEATAHI